MKTLKLISLTRQAMTPLMITIMMLAFIGLIIVFFNVCVVS